MVRPVVVLPQPRLAHQAERLALLDVEADVVDGLDVADGAAEDAAQDREDRSSGSAPAAASRRCRRSMVVGVAGVVCVVSSVTAIRHLCYHISFSVSQRLADTDGSQYSQHRAELPSSSVFSGGSSSRQTAITCGQRGANGQPLGRLSGLGTVPGITLSR